MAPTASSKRVCRVNWLFAALVLLLILQPQASEAIGPIEIKPWVNCAAADPSGSLTTSSPSSIDVRIRNADPNYDWSWTVTRADGTTLSDSKSSSKNSGQDLFISRGVITKDTSYCPSTTLQWVNSLGVSFYARGACSDCCRCCTWDMGWLGCWWYENCGCESSTTVWFDVRVANLECSSIYTSAPLLSSPADGTIYNPGTSVSLQWTKASVGLEVCLCKGQKLYLGSDSTYKNNPSVDVGCNARSYTVNTPASNTESNQWYYWNAVITPLNIDNPNDKTTADGALRKFCIRGTPVVTLSSPISDVYVAYDQSLTLNWAVNNWGFSCTTTTAKTLEIKVYCPSSLSSPTFAPTLPSTSSTSYSFVPSQSAAASSSMTCKWTATVSNGLTTTSTGTFKTCTTISPVAPVLQSPAADASLTAPTGSSSVSTTLKWSHTDFGNTCPPQASATATTLKGSYIILLDTEKPPKKQFRTVSAETSSITVSWTSSGTWYWQVVAVSGTTGFNTGSAVNKLSVCVGTAPGTPTPNSPASSEVITIPLGSASKSLGFTWTKPSDSGSTCTVTKVDTYTVTLYNSLNAVVGQSSVVSGSSTTTGIPVTTSGVYHYVITLSNGEQTVTSSTVSFTVCKQEAPAVPAIATILPLVKTPTYTFSWTELTIGEACSGTTTTAQYRVFFVSGSTAIDFSATPTIILQHPTTSYQATGLTTGTWHFGVVADNLITRTSSADTTVAVCLPVAPAIPSVIKPSEAVDSTLLVPFEWSVSSWGQPCDATGGDSLVIYAGNTTTSMAVILTITDGSKAAEWTAPAKGLYYYKLVSSNGALSSETQTFSVRVKMNCMISAMDSPVLKSPLHSVLLYSHTVDLSWSMGFFGESCVIGASNSSHFELHLDGQVVDSWVASSADKSVTLSVDEGNHVWFVVAKNGNLTTYSTTNGTFTVCVPIAAAAPVLHTPTNNSIVMSPVTVSWLPSSVTSWNHSCGLTQQYRVSMGGKESVVMSAVDTNDQIITDTMSQQWTIDTEGIYNWCVWSVLTTGGVEEWSTKAIETRSIQLCKPKTPSSPSLGTSPTANYPYIPPVQFEWSLASTARGESCAVGVGAEKFVVSVMNETSSATLFNITATANDNTVMSNLSSLATGTYSWKVSFFNGLQWSISETRSIKVCWPIAPQQPQLSSPSNASIIGVWKGTDETFQLKWEAATTDMLGTSCLVETDPKLMVLVAQRTTEGGQLSIVMNKTVDSWEATSLDVSESLFSAAGEYVWWITLSNGRQQASSSLRSFTLCVKRLPNGLNITKPSRNNTLLSTTLVDLSWTLYDIGESCSGPSTVKRYEVLMGDPGQSSSEMVSKGQYGITTTTTTLTSAAGEYDVVVRVINGVFTFESAGRRFRVCLAEDPVTPVLVSPETGTSVIRPRVDNTTVASNITINTNITLVFSVKPVSSFGVSCSIWASTDSRKRATTASMTYNGYTLLLGPKESMKQVTTMSENNAADAPNGVIQFTYPISLLANGVYWWNIVATNRDGKTSSDTTRVVTICQAPVATTLLELPTNTVNVSTSNIKLTWKPIISEDGWGFSCTGVYNHRYKIYLDETNLTSVNSTTTSSSSSDKEGTHTFLAYSPSTLSSYTVPSSAVSSNRTYKWYVGVHNGGEETLAGPFYFTTVAKDCRDVSCGDNGDCDEVTLMCVCDPGWSGDSCDIKDKSNTTIIAAVVSCGVVAVLMLFGGFIVLLATRRRMKQNRKKVQLQAPAADQKFSPLKTPSAYNGDPMAFESKLMIDASESFRMIMELGIKIESSQSDDFAKAAVYAYQRLNCSVQMVEALITKEVNSSVNTSVLFRSNSMSTKAFKYYSKMIGVQYLFKTLAPLLQELMQKEEDAKDDQKELDQLSKSGKMVSTKLFSDTTEVDPDAMSDEELEDLSVHSLQLCLTAQKFITQITRSIKTIPPQLQRICRHVHTAVLRQFGPSESKMAISSIGTFIFLRFINVAITVPEAYGLLKTPPSMSLRRNLVLTAKIIQNLSNGHLFGNKEGYMDAFNQVITDNIPKMEQFYQTLITSTVSATSSQVEVPDDVYKNSLANLHFLYLNNEEALQATTSHSATAMTSPMTGRTLKLPPLPLQGRQSVSVHQQQDPVADTSMSVAAESSELFIPPPTELLN